MLKFTLFNLFNFIIILFLRNFYSGILFFGTALLFLTSIFVFFILIITFFMKKLTLLDYRYYLALFCNISAIVLLYYLFTKYDVPTDTKIWSELFLQGFFVFNTYYFLISFIATKFKLRTIQKKIIVWRSLTKP